MHAIRVSIQTLLITMTLFLGINANALACGSDITTGFIYPLEDWYETCGFDTECGSDHHMGVDGIPTGTGGSEHASERIGAEVIAPCTGLVKEAQEHGGYGGMVIMECWTGDECVTPFAAHMFTDDITVDGTSYEGLQVSPGEIISAGDVIGYIADEDNNGGWAPHVHFGIRKGTYASASYSGCIDDYGVASWYYAAYPGSGEGSCYDAIVADMYNPNTFIADHPGDGSSGTISFECTYISDYFCAETESTSDTPDEGTWTDTSLQMDLVLSGTQGSFTISRTDGTSFTSEGTMYLKVGSYEEHAVDHDSVDIDSSTGTSVTLTDDFGCYDVSSFPKEIYARYEASSTTGYEVVGPIGIDAMILSNPDLSAPTGLIVESLGSDSIGVSWDEVSGATEYRICRSESEDTGYTQVSWDSDDIFFDSGSHLEPSRRYYYKIAAGNSEGWSDFSDPISDVTEDEGSDTGGLAKTDHDSDDDGYTSSEGDCDDSSSSVHPGASEFCGDGIDQDCDGSDESCATDSDGDGLTDEEEAALGTDPDDIDSDDDGYQDGFEILDGTDPLDSDSDDDGVMDGGDRCNHTSPVSADDVVDSHGCALSQLDEDRDGYSDYDETYVYGTDPDDSDTDDDGIVDGSEAALGFDPLNSDTDGDGILDGDESLIEAIEGTDDYIFADSDDATDYFGVMVDTDDNVAVVRAYRYKSRDDHINRSGAVTVYRWDGSEWNSEALLLPYDNEDPETLKEDRYGYALSVDGNVIAVSAYVSEVSGDDKAGAVYIYRYNEDSGLWEDETKITSPGGINFGFRVSVSGNLMAIGCSGYTDGTTYVAYPGTSTEYIGAVYIYRYDEDTGNWNQEALIKGADTDDDGDLDIWLGDGTVDIDGENERVIIGGSKERSPDSEDLFLGSAYIHKYNADTESWELEAELTGSATSSRDYFGNAVAIEGNWAVVGSHRDGPDTGTETGSVYTFYLGESGWAETQRLIASDATYYAYFGTSISLDNKTLVIGSPKDVPGEMDSGQGAYVFRLSGDTWVQEEKITPESTADNYTYSQSVAVSGDWIIVGWPYHEETFAYNRPLLDEDDDGVIDSFDDCEDTSPVSEDDVVDEEGCALSQTDSDSDGLSDYHEIYTSLTDPENDDTDSDGYPDGADSDPLVADSDADGVPDTDDLCPGTADIETVDSDGCADGERDSDGDGVMDADDLCPSTSSLSESDTVDADGCARSERDTDGDGLTDFEEMEHEIKLVAFDADASDDFSWHMAANGDRLLVSAKGDEADSGSGSTGSVYVYEKTDSTWELVEKVTASDGEGHDYFGSEVDLDGDVMIVGAYGDDDVAGDAGAAYIYRWNGSTWDEEAKLTASDGLANDYFGYSVAISGNVAIVGAMFDDDLGAASGSVYVYRYNGSSWDEEAKLNASDGEAHDRFGDAIAIHDDVILVGAYNQLADGDGAAYIYRYNGSTWDEEAILTASDEEAAEDFGFSVALADGVAVIGDYKHDGSTTNSGAAYVFRYNGSTWDEEAFLTPLADDELENDIFATSVAIEDNTIVVSYSADDDTATDSGAAYVYKWDGSAWNFYAKLWGSDSIESDGFGKSIAIANNTVFAGSYRITVDGAGNAGAAYIYDLSYQYSNPFITDSDNDGLSDYEEVTTYGTNPGDPDTDGDGLNDSEDPEPLVPDTSGSDSSTYTVTTTEDIDDGVCDATHCSVREAINASNAVEGSDTVTIAFDIPSTDAGCSSLDSVCTVYFDDILPDMTRGNVIIDGYTQTGALPNTLDFPNGLDTELKIYWDGSGTTYGEDALAIKSANNVIKGVGIVNFKNHAIVINGASASNNKIQGCFIGVDASGLTSLRNVGAGIVIQNNASGNYVGIDGDGSDEASERNLISGNNGNGFKVALTGNNTTVAGNVIGRSADLSTILPNKGHGVYIKAGSHVIGSNLDGVSDDLEGNILSGNGKMGVHLNLAGTIGVQIRRNSFYDNTGMPMYFLNHANGDKTKAKILAASLSGTTLDVSGEGTVGDEVDVYLASSDYEGKTHLGTTTVDADGTWSFNTETTEVTSGSYLRTIASDDVNGTSIFAQKFLVP